MEMSIKTRMKTLFRRHLYYKIMVQVLYLLGVSLSLLIGQHQVLAQESLPPGKHNLYVEVGLWGTGGLCQYIYGVDRGKYPPNVASFENCDEYRKNRSNWAFISKKPGEIEVRSPCSGDKFDVLKKIGDGKLSNGNPMQSYQGDICA
jgi:hypothetical protein